MLNHTTLSRLFSTSLAALFLLAALAPPARAGGPQVWETDSREELLKGEARGVSVTDTGALMLAPQITKVFDTEQAYVWSSASDSQGNVYLGTGHDGRVYRVGADGRGALLYDTQELDVTALVVGRDGAIYAGTSPDGKVYRIASDGRADVYFDPPDKYIWSLAVMSDGALAVGTGDKGKIYRVRAGGAKPEESLLVDINETHIISLAVDSNGNLVAGTDPGGLVLSISPQGKAFALFDSPLREIHSIAPGANGSLYVLALSDAASSGRSQPQTPQATSTPSSSGGTTVTSSVVIDESGSTTGTQMGVAQQTPARSRNELSTARSAVFRLSADGGADVLWSSPTVTAFAVAPSPRAGAGVFVGTNDKGRVYSVTDDGRDTLLVQSSEDQISSFVVRGGDVFAASSNQGKLFRLSDAPAGEGTYESAVRDAKFNAAWGRIWWRGRGAVELQTRSGNTERPDATWSDWSAPYRAPAGEAITSPRARFIQWRATLRAPAPAAANAEAARVEDVSVAYLPRNVAPEVLAITTLPVGVALLPAIQVQTDPNVEASGIDPSLFGPVPQVPPRRAYQRGAVSLQWQAEDRNGDSLEYSIYYRALGESSFRLLKDRLRDNFYTVDGAALGDGRYVFRVVASDAPDNAVGAALTGERTSEPVDVDNTPPVVRAADTPRATGGMVSVTFVVEDAGGIVKRADVSVDGGAWREVFPEDGIADSPRETYALSLPMSGEGEHTVALRGFDASGNMGNARVVVRR
ncbi:MAG: SMP-30/gluconolactonase/LRE family protein [Acidobacteria bacterium]|nr:SMP-30/gluconolactonase/LRE family protein [Acidobacteriota bacterium]